MEGNSVDVVLRFVALGPPLAPAKAFSRSGCGRIFPLFSRVMRVGLLTVCAIRVKSGILVDATIIASVLRTRRRRLDERV